MEDIVADSTEESFQSLLAGMAVGDYLANPEDPHSFYQTGPLVTVTFDERGYPQGIVSAERLQAGSPRLKVSDQRPPIAAALQPLALTHGASPPYPGSPPASPRGPRGANGPRHRRLRHPLRTPRRKASTRPTVSRCDHRRRADRLLAAKPALRDRPGASEAAAWRPSPGPPAAGRPTPRRHPSTAPAAPPRIVRPGRPLPLHPVRARPVGHRPLAAVPAR